MSLRVGDSLLISINSVGSKSFDFSVVPGGKRNMIFRTVSDNVVAAVSKISVAETVASVVNPGPDPGHYLSFSRERNLKTEVLDVMDSTAGTSAYQRQIADQLDAALTTPGVKGFSVTIDWRTVETGDGVYNWRLVDDNMQVAERYGLSFVVKILDRSFDDSNVMPAYFPGNFLVWSVGGGNAGFVAKRWEPYVYTRMIRLYRAIANRYRNNPRFGGIATTESALGDFDDPGYTVAKYQTALTEIATQTQDALSNARLFWYLNFIRGSNAKDLNKDVRVELVSSVPHALLAVGGPDITPDVQGMPGSVNSFRVHVRKTMPGVTQFCHAQHVDLGLGNRNTKSNKYRQSYLNQVATVRKNESQPGFNGAPAAFEFDDLDPSAADAFLHPNWKVGETWQPNELFDFARRNFGCDYFFWNYRPPAGENSSQFTWPDIRPIIVGNQNVFQW
jgi:hypothetical protein